MVDVALICYILKYYLKSTILTKNHQNYTPSLRARYDRILKNDYYILKCDISKFFASIDLEILKKKIYRRIKDKDALEIIESILDSYDGGGICIGSNSSQILAIYYLNDLDHYIKEELKIKYYVCFQDDFLLFHRDKIYLKECFKKIEIFLQKEGLTLNKKSRIYSDKDNFIFLGRSKYGKYHNYRKINKNIKLKKSQYINGNISISSYVSSMVCYNSLND